MKRNRKRIVAVLCAGLAWVGATPLRGDEARCPVVAAGVLVMPNNTVQIVGQGVIGRADNGVVFQHAGAISCYQVEITCRLGDVNGDGLIDGDDVDPYVRVSFTGIGTPRELCAANLPVPAFVALLLDM